MYFPWLLTPSKRLSLFSPQLQWYIVSVDVTFFETTLFYTSIILDVNLIVKYSQVSLVPIQVVVSPQRPLLQYHKRVQTSIVTHSTNPQASSPAPTTPSLTPLAPELPSAIRKATYSFRNPNLLYTFTINYDHTPFYFFFGFYVYS